MGSLTRVQSDGKSVNPAEFLTAKKCKCWQIGFCTSAVSLVPGRQIPARSQPDDARRNMKQAGADKGLAEMSSSSSLLLSLSIDERYGRDRCVRSLHARFSVFKYLGVQKRNLYSAKQVTQLEPPVTFYLVNQV